MLSGDTALLVSNAADAEGSKSRLSFRGTFQRRCLSLFRLCVSGQRYLCANSDKILIESEMFR